MNNNLLTVSYVLFTEAKVGDLYVTVLVQQQIFELQISVNDALRVQVAKSRYDFGAVELGCILGENAQTTQMEE